jgi:hypothetical protein
MDTPACIVVTTEKHSALKKTNLDDHVTSP